mmetsp:Transcript_20010/g.66172  ORF Transcript_20010/g.66172 Transcript_20010/m.66172 type:complete len:303 (-) Transcript_20010:478-1386(-)
MAKSLRTAALGGASLGVAPRPCICRRFPARPRTGPQRLARRKWRRRWSAHSGKSQSCCASEAASSATCRCSLECGTFTRWRPCGTRDASCLTRLTSLPRWRTFPPPSSGCGSEHSSGYATRGIPCSARLSACMSGRSRSSSERAISCLPPPRATSPAPGRCSTPAWGSTSRTTLVQTRCTRPRPPAISPLCRSCSLVAATRMRATSMAPRRSPARCGETVWAWRSSCSLPVPGWPGRQRRRRRSCALPRRRVGRSMPSWCCCAASMQTRPIATAVPRCTSPQLRETLRSRSCWHVTAPTSRP